MESKKVVDRARLGDTFLGELIWLYDCDFRHTKVNQRASSIKLIHDTGKQNAAQISDCSAAVPSGHPSQRSKSTIH